MMSSIVQNIISDGSSKIHIITDFDRTLTQAFVDGEYKPSLISVLYTEWYLSEHYQHTAQGFFNYYHPIEVNDDIALEEKKQAMTERREKHEKLLIDEWLTKSHIYEAMQTHGVVLRTWVQDFLRLCAEKDIPVVVFSASGIGVVAIERFLQRDGLMTPNVHIVSNDFVRDADGRAVDFHRPVIHTFNKGETVLSEYDFADQITSRPNIILMGDSIGDASMADGSHYENLLKIGFLNKDIEEKRELYQKHFDIIIENDGSMDTINDILYKLT